MFKQILKFVFNLANAFGIIYTITVIAKDPEGFIETLCNLTELGNLKTIGIITVFFGLIVLILSFLISQTLRFISRYEQQVDLLDQIGFIIWNKETSKTVKKKYDRKRALFIIIRSGSIIVVSGSFLILCYFIYSYINSL